MGEASTKGPWRPWEKVRGKIGDRRKKHYSRRLQKVGTGVVVTSAMSTRFPFALGVCVLHSPIFCPLRVSTRGGGLTNTLRVHPWDLGTVLHATLIQHDEIALAVGHQCDLEVQGCIFIQCSATLGATIVLRACISSLRSPTKHRFPFLSARKRWHGMVKQKGQVIILVGNFCTTAGVQHSKEMEQKGWEGRDETKERE